MTTNRKTKTTTAVAYEAARRDREAAEQAHDERAPIVSPPDAVLDVLTRAVATLGYRLASSYNAVTLKTA